MSNHEETIRQMDKVKKTTNNPDLKRSIERKREILSGDKTIKK